ncbi:RNA binding protein [Ascosphaera apis ARSEF 7405]|uniref:RNA binding protein n=1 Tax=Ascosphaera apis ARSEF 7405 TaxID=392613 RepID=A0A168CQC9_9EURO|nr:RNA binding protein [Ascosphaera apis ARSEF 7405]
MGDKRKLSPVADEAPIEEKKIKKSKHDKKKKSKKEKKTVEPVADVKDTVTEVPAVEEENATNDKQETQPESPVKPSETQTEESKDVKKSKKNKESKKNKKTKQEGSDGTENKTSNKEGEPHAEEENAESQPAKNVRFIVFVGNLPFGITQEQVQQHFAKIRPTQVRLATEKDSKKSRGFAFVEFDNYDRMKTCLKLYHHSLLDDGKGNSRKINCELSAGGGGKSEYRKQKIQYKNEKLAAQRAHTAQLAQVTKKKKEKREQFEGKSTQPVEEVDNSGIHPSRRNRVPGA